MNATNDLERRLVGWLEREGPDDVPTYVVEAALAEARAIGQRRVWLTWGLRDRRRRASMLTLPVARVSRRLALVVVLLALLAALIGGLLAVGALPRTPVTALTSCPAGSVPNEPGPADQARPGIRFSASAVWHGRAGRLLYLEETSRIVWSFDVCTNRWHAGRAPVGGPPWDRSEAAAYPPSRGTLVYDEDSDVIVAIAYGVWTYDLDADAWKHKGLPPSLGLGQAVYDPRTGLVIGRNPATAEMWTYDVDTDTWLSVGQRGSLPPREANTGAQLPGFDRAADRLVLYTNTGTWLFDPRARTWAFGGGGAPVVFFISPGGLVYNEANQQTLLYGEGVVAAYDMAAKAWQVLYDTRDDGGLDDPSAPGFGYPLAYDPLNKRVLVTKDGLGISAFDPDTGRMTELTPSWQIRSSTP